MAIRLNQNENHFPHSPLCQEVFQNLDPKLLSEYSVHSPRLIDKISEYFNVELHNIVLGYGGEDIIKQSFAMLLFPDDYILLPRCGWYYYQELAEQYQSKIIFYDMIEGENSFNYDIEQITSLIGKYEPKIVLLNSPNNPTGSILSKEEINQIVESLSAKTYVIFDEAYWGFAEFDYSYHDLYKVPNIMVLRTFSKLFSLAGLRVGFAFIGANWSKLRIRLSRYLGFTHLTEKIAIASLESQEYYHGIARTINSEACRYQEELKKLNIKVFPAHCNFVFLKTSTIQFESLQEAFLKSNMIIKFFNSEKEPQFKNCIRITIGLPDENTQVIDLFKKVLMDA